MSILGNVTFTALDSASILGGMSETTGTRRRARVSKGDQREAQILAAARELLRERPFTAVTIDDLAAAAGISRTSFYFYFPTKHAVLAALLEEVWNQFASTHVWLDSTGPSPDTLREQLRAAAAIWREHAQILACADAAGSAYEPLEEFLIRARQRYVERTAAKIRRDRAAGLAPAGIPAESLAEMLSAIRDARMAHVDRASEDAGEQAVREIADATLLLVYGAAPAA